MRDMGVWLSDCMTYNDHFLENQELVNKLQMNIDEPHGRGSMSWEEDQSERINMDENLEEVFKIVRKITKQSVKFEPTRQRLKSKIYMMQ